jgi:hypothetical protein
MYLWIALCRRLSQSVDVKPADERYSHRQLFSHLFDGSIEGIIFHLTETHSVNVEERVIVSISGSSMMKNSYLPRYAADLKTTNFFYSTNSRNQ